MPTIHIIAGPTASGKSAKAMDLARSENGVIINCDSMQIYNGLPILTAQPNTNDQKTVPHALYGTRSPNDVCSAGNWRELAEPLIHSILENGQTPVICGGTGLYIKALTEGLSPIPDIPEDIRSAVVAQHESLGPDKFYARLKEKDSEMAARYHPNHKARLIRAMEVIEATGHSLAWWQKKARLAPPASWSFQIHKVMLERETLYARCNGRLLRMIERGALEEIEAFAAQIEQGRVKKGVPLTKALGFKPLLAYIKGELSKAQAIDRAQGETRRYAKRQVTWFRNQL